MNSLLRARAPIHCQKVILYGKCNGFSVFLHNMRISKPPALNITSLCYGFGSYFCHFPWVGFDKGKCRMKFSSRVCWKSQLKKKYISACEIGMYRFSNFTFFPNENSICRNSIQFALELLMALMLCSPRTNSIYIKQCFVRIIMEWRYIWLQNLHISHCLRIIYVFKIDRFVISRVLSCSTIYTFDLIQPLLDKSFTKCRWPIQFRNSNNSWSEIRATNFE